MLCYWSYHTVYLCLPYLSPRTDSVHLYCFFQYKLFSCFVFLILPHFFYFVNHFFGKKISCFLFCSIFFTTYDVRFYNICSRKVVQIFFKKIAINRITTLFYSLYLFTSFFSIYKKRLGNSGAGKKQKGSCINYPCCNSLI